MADRISVKLLFFAKARELVGQNEAEVNLTRNTFTKKTLLDEITSIYEILQPLVNCLLLAVNEKYVDSSEVVQLKDDDIVAVMPPLSGG